MIDNIVVDLLYRRADYDILEKPTKLLLKRNGTVFKKIKTTKNIIKIIKNV